MKCEKGIVVELSEHLIRNEYTETESLVKTHAFVCIDASY